MKQVIILFCCTLLCFQACKTSTEQTGIGIVKWPLEKSLPMKALIDSVEFISLEVSDSAILGYPIFVSYTSEKIYVMGNESDARIKVFDGQGKFLNNIGSKGRGPGEYLNVFNWSVSGDTLYVPDCIQNKLLLYRTDGCLIDERPIPDQIKKALGDKEVHGLGMKILENGYFITPIKLMFGQEIKQGIRNFLITDRNFQLREVSEKDNKRDEEVYLVWVNPNTKDSLFLLSCQGKLIGQFYFDFGGDNITQQAIKQLSLNELLQQKSFISGALVVNDYIFLDVMQKGERLRCAFDWRNGQFYMNSDEVDINGKVLNILAACPLEHSILSLISSPSSAGFKELPEEMQHALEENGGVVLVKYWLKN